MTRSITARLALGFLFTLAALLVISGLAGLTFSRLFNSVTLIQDHHLRETSLFEDIRVLLTDAVNQDRAYILSIDDVYDEAFEADIDEITRLFEAHAALHATVPITPPEVAGIEELRAAVTRLAAVQDQVQELVVEGQLQAARVLSEQRGQEAARPRRRRAPADPG